MRKLSSKLSPISLETSQLVLALVSLNLRLMVPRSMHLGEDHNMMVQLYGQRRL